MERPPPHSVQAISAKRTGGKKVPKRYRKYHTKHKSKKEKGDRASNVAHYLIKGIRAVMEGIH